MFSCKNFVFKTGLLALNIKNIIKPRKSHKIKKQNYFPPPPLLPPNSPT